MSRIFCYTGYVTRGRPRCTGLRLRQAFLCSGAVELMQDDDPSRKTRYEGRMKILAWTAPARISIVIGSSCRCHSEASSNPQVGRDDG